MDEPDRPALTRSPLLDPECQLHDGSLKGKLVLIDLE